MRIVIITDAWEPQVNGVVRTYQNIISELKREGHDVKIISPIDFPRKIRLQQEIDWVFAPYKRLEKMINNFNPDAIHIAVEGSLGLAGRRYCKRYSRPFTTSFHTHFPDYMAKRVPRFMRSIIRNIAIKMMRWFHKPAKSIYVATDSLEQQLQSWGFRNQFVRLVRGVNTDIFYPSPQKNKTHKPILIYVGRVAIEKNIDAFLSLNIDAHKMVVGQGPDLEKLKHKYPKIEFLGLKEGQELGDCYRRADCFVFPSKTDTFGIVLIEAMACGLPIAGYNVTGPKDLITSPNLGAVDDDLKIAVQKALASKGDVTTRFAHVQSNYTWDQVAKTFIKHHGKTVA